MLIRFKSIFEWVGGRFGVGIADVDGQENIKLNRQNVQAKIEKLREAV